MTPLKGSYALLTVSGCAKMAKSPLGDDDEGVMVPLSEDEQRILSEIERSFYEQDPKFAREVSSATVSSRAGRNLKWATLGFVAGLVLMLVSFASSIILGFVGFIVMLGCAVVFERNLRRMGRAGWRSMTSSLGKGGLQGSLDKYRKRLRSRFHREEGEA